MKSRNLILAVIVAAGVGVAVVAAVLGNLFAAKAPSIALLPSDAKVLAQGEKLYQAHCASCHGAKLEGQPNWRSRGADGLLPAPPHDQSGHTWHHPDEVLFRITKYGVAKAANLKDYASAMPVYERVLSDEEIIASLSWIKAQWPTAVREKHDQINAESLRTPKR
jgi:S-disulfanyl-L-cysteine oxidoreductase SoxD